MLRLPRWEHKPDFHRLANDILRESNSEFEVLEAILLECGWVEEWGNMVMRVRYLVGDETEPLGLLATISPTTLKKMVDLPPTVGYFHLEDEHELLQHVKFELIRRRKSIHGEFDRFKFPNWTNYP